MVFAAISQVTQGHVYIATIDALTAPDIRAWLRTPFTPEAEDNRVVHYMVPTIDITLSEDGPVNLIWVTSDLILERHSSNAAMTMRPNLFHSTSDTFRVVFMIVRDRPRYVVIGWNVPFEPIISLAENGTDGTVSSLITAPANLLQVANFQAPVHRWMETYDSDSEAPPTPQNEFGPGEDDSPPPAHLRDHDSDLSLDHEDDQKVPTGEE